MEGMMNKLTRTSLVVLITLMVLLAVTIPVQAKTQSDSLVEYTLGTVNCDYEDVDMYFMYQWRRREGIPPPIVP
jgi:hypothetical protein